MECHVLDAGERRRTGSTAVARDQDNIGMRLATPAAIVPTPTSATSTLMRARGLEFFKS